MAGYLFNTIAWGVHLVDRVRHGHDFTQDFEQVYSLKSQNPGVEQP